ncbi:MAG: nitroreductase family deazaflavin-dependent oxidoreductase [Actinomycetota bacterium]|nr:nitroreductase family deazaflavin-dependent oxidoreductase [Actinomycetota bacterium]
MTDSVTAEVQLPEDKPPEWANSMMKWALTTPGLQAMVGKGVALLTVTGWRSGKTYTIPVSYHREDDTVTIVTKRVRNWWRNFSSPHEVQLRLAGRNYKGMAAASTGGSEMLGFMMGYLEKRPIDAKAYGLSGEITSEKVARILPYIVLIRIALTST